MAVPHKTIADTIMAELRSKMTPSFIGDQMAIFDYESNNPINSGINIVPLGDEEGIGTNERDDVDYATLIVRSTHALGNDDMEAKSLFKDEVRRIFHHKRIALVDSSNQLYCRVDFGPISIPQKWKSNNNSVTAIKVMTLLRETRDI